MSNPPRLIIEGTNYSGKDTLISALAPYCKNSLVIQTRGYFRKALTNLKDQGGLGLDASYLLRYFQERTLSLLPIIKSVIHEELIFQRLHLTDIVYCFLYLNAEQDYSGLESELNQVRVALILLDIDNESLERRQSKDPRGASGHVSRSLPDLIKRRDLYRKFFNESQMQRKILINNSDGICSPDEQAKSILDWWKNQE